MSAIDSLRELFQSDPPWIMGVLNLTPDSFSDGGRYLEPRAVLERVLQLHSSGAVVIDIGAEATGPGSAPISAPEEIARMEAAFPIPGGAVYSLDTYKASTARFGLERGARIINDTSGLQADPNLAPVVRDFGAYVILMHSKSTTGLPHADDTPRRYDDVVRDIADHLHRRIDFALRAGIPENRILVDPGMGKFISLQAQDSWELLSRYDELCLLMRPFPVLVGTSRKGFLGGKLEDRDPISQLTALDAVRKGAAIVRTHNVAMARAFLEADRLLDTKTGFRS